MHLRPPPRDASRLGERVVEIGAGNGLDFGPSPTVTEVAALEPEPHLRMLATGAAPNAKVLVPVVDGLTERLPLDGASCGPAVSSLVLCSVTDQGVALGEARRVLRPGGELRGGEHVIDGDPKFARFHGWVAGGCRVTRNAEGAIVRAGLEISRNRNVRFAPELLIGQAAPQTLGAARLRDDTAR